MSASDREPIVDVEALRLRAERAERLLALSREAHAATVACLDEATGAYEKRRAAWIASERDVAALRHLLRAAIDGTLPDCEACDSAPATTTTPAGFHACDAHRSPDSADLPYAAVLRAALDVD